MHHVAAVASKVHPNGRLPEESRRCRLLTWGKGIAGQLGNEQAKDFNLPQVSLPPSRSRVCFTFAFLWR